MNDNRIELIDQSVPANHDPAQPVANLYRCTECGYTQRALTRARAENGHRTCGKPLTLKGTAEDNEKLREQVATLAAHVAALTAPPTPAVTAENGPKKRGRPKKAKAESPTPA